MYAVYSSILPYTAIRRKCPRLLNASLRTNRQYRFTMQQSHKLRVSNISNSNNTSKFNIINNKNNKYLLSLNYDRVRKTKKRIGLLRVALLWIRTRKPLTARLWF